MAGLDSPVLLADEPTGNLDTRTTAAVMKLFEDLNSEGMTIVMVTHSSRCAAHVHRVLTVADGRLCTGKDLARQSLAVDANDSLCSGRDSERAQMSSVC